jgi:integration host factor subunit beta
MTQQQTAQVVDLILASVVEHLQTGDKGELRGFGSFRRRARCPCQGRNPKTGDTVEVPAQIVPFFTAGKLDSRPTKSTSVIAVRLDARMRRSDDDQDAKWHSD